jgi:hypothetical protein
MLGYMDVTEAESGGLSVSSISSIIMIEPITYLFKSYSLCKLKVQGSELTN